MIEYLSMGTIWRWIPNLEILILAKLDHSRPHRQVMSRSRILLGRANQAKEYMKEKVNQYQSMNPLLRLGIEMGPLGIFFVVNASHGIFAATGVFMVAIVLSLVIAYVAARHIPTLPVVSGVIVIIFGGLTLYLQDEIFIKLKPTIVNILFAGAIFGGLLFGKNYVKSLLGTMVELKDEGWRHLAVRWGLFFLAMAIVNEVVWRNLTTDAWVAFKVFGFLPLTVVFALAQTPLMNRYAAQGGSK